MKNFVLIALAGLLLSSCAVVRPGEAGVRSKLGVLKGDVKTGGPMLYNPFTSTVLKVPVQTVNREISISLPSREGLTIKSDVSILYRIKENKVKHLIMGVGKDYDNILISVFRSASSDVCARFYAKDMHSGQRALIEEQIADKMNELLGERGFEIEAVLLKSITLPAGLARAVENKLEAEQRAEEMEFVLTREKREAERKIIEAEGTRDAQLIISEGLTEEILRLRNIEMMRDLIKSGNTKVIITDGKSPAFINTP